MAADAPDRVRGQGDAGDDVYHRYRYQSTYAAMLAVEMIRAGTRVVEVFCEHHDDILLKLSDGRFHAVQVKTREQGGTPFKSDDDAIRNALAKFLRHEMAFGEQFERYTIATNHHFFREAGNSKSLFCLTETAKQVEGAEDSMDSKLSRYVQCFLRDFNQGKRGSERATETQMLRVLCKLFPNHELPKLDQVHRELVDTISKAKPEFGASTLADIRRAADALSTRTFQASSRFEEEATRGYLSLARDPIAEETAQIILCKRLVAADVENIINGALREKASLTAADPICPGCLPSDLTIAEKKMAFGGLSATTLAASKDWYASAQHLEREWAAKYGESEALERYNHVGTAVQTVCAHAQEAARPHGEPYGPKMLDHLRSGLNLRRQSETKLYGCDEEHLLGHAVIRTEQCKVWWSEPFDLGGLS